MFFVKFINGTQWHIVDDNQETVFIGTKQQAEDWLDFQENARRQPMPAAAAPGRIGRSLQLLFRRVQQGLAQFRGRPADSQRSLPAFHRHAPKH